MRWMFLLRWVAVLWMMTFAATASAEGMLIARDPDGRDAGSFPLVRTTVEGEIAGDIVAVQVTQRFRNTFSSRLEAVYTFPLPENAAVDAMEMRVGTRVVVATIRRRDEARRTYETARAQGNRAALLEQERPNIFTFSVANIDPGGEIEVRLHYFERAHYDHGVYQTVFPMTVGPRYIPGNAVQTPGATGTAPNTDRVPDGSRISPPYTAPNARSGHAISLRMQVDGGGPVGWIETPAHDCVAQRPTPSRFTVTLRDKDEIPNRDFILRWRLNVDDVRAAVFTHRPDANRDGYFAVTLAPRNDPAPENIVPREIFFLLDTSGSMSGVPIATAKAAVQRALETLHAHDTFQIIDFADTASRMSPFPLENSHENIQRGLQYLANLTSGGGTNQLAGIHAALNAPGNSERLRYVVFMTDGYIGNEREVIGLTQREIGNARIFSFGIGSSVNRFLLTEVALAGRGFAEFLRPNEEASAMVERFYQRIGKPYLADIAVDWGAAGVRDTHPSPTPDLSAFQPMVIYGRYHEAGPRTVHVRGRLGNQPFDQTLSIDLPAVDQQNAAISRLWARERIATFQREMTRNGESPELIESITTTALEHHLVSSYTSFVAVDEVRNDNTPPGAPLQVVQPNAAPQGVNLAAAGGATVGNFDFSDEPIQGQLVRPDGTNGSMRRSSGVTSGNYDPRTPNYEPPQGSGDTLSVSQRRGGCAGCSVPDGTNGTSGALMALVFAVLSLRRKRTSQ
jgi:Ca-activated chloride channel homolog